jgi:hypothetical protein
MKPNLVIRSIFVVLTVFLLFWNVYFFKKHNKNNNINFLRHKSAELLKSKQQSEILREKQFFEENANFLKMEIKFSTEQYIDKSRESFQPWPNLTEIENGIDCSKFRNHFAKNGSFLPTTWLYSYPGSGNTWLRYLIEGATGFFTRGPDPIVRSHLNKT